MKEQKKIRVLIADDHQMVIDGLKSLIKTEKDIEVVAEAINGNQVISWLLDIEVEIVVLDIEMPGMNGVETTKKIKELYPEVKILILTMYNEIEFIKNVISIGAQGYILKNRGQEELVKAIKIISSGDEYFGDSVTKTLISEIKRKDKLDQFVKLTKREIDVLKLIANSKTTPQIAEELFIAPSTVETHRRHLIEKTGVPNSKALVKYAIENKYI
ncbi:response regulator transcription factor [uncultured Aquimarina sp.]|uniref:response regulator transcription factor n=1 Tax=uncultured Aquimarina sp. TaxID=575652 RepID=UPI0026231D0D|nr:response regulator transcription factor [uncultured Aquimarina sp.]